MLPVRSPGCRQPFFHCGPDAAMNDLSAEILRLQGEGDYEGVTKLVEQRGSISPALQSDLDRLTDKEIPVDVVFEQGVEVLGLNQ